MPAANYNFVIEQGSDFILTFKYKNQDNQAIDLSSKCIVMQWTTSDGYTKQQFSSGANTNYNVDDWSMVGDNSGVITLRISANLTKDFNFQTAIYDLDVVTIAAPPVKLRNTRLATGLVTLIKRNTILLETCPVNVNSQINLVTPPATSIDGVSPTLTPTLTGPVIIDEDDLCLPEDCLNLDIYSVVYAGSGLSLPDLSTTSGSVITVDNRPIENIEIAINKLQHDSPSDLIFLLSPPSGDKILLSANSKIKIPDSNNNFSFTFSNKATSGNYLHNMSKNGGVCNIYNKTHLVSYNDEPLLSGFDHFFGVSATGQWSLIVKDTDPNGSGLIDSWKLIVTYSPPEE